MIRTAPRPWLFLALLAAGFAAGLAAATQPARAQAVNDFPTVARVEYVLVCMDANGRSPETLRRCACKVDELAALISYEDYLAAETVLRMQQMPGERSAVFRSPGMTTAVVDRFRLADSEADLICF